MHIDTKSTKQSIWHKRENNGSDKTLIFGFGIDVYNIVDKNHTYRIHKKSGKSRAKKSIV
nr:hypothetical protein 1 [bacterium]